MEPGARRGPCASVDAGRDPGGRPRREAGTSEDTAGPFGGRHQGHEAIAGVLGGLFRWTAGTLRMEVQDIFADGVHGVVLIAETATRARDGARLSVREVHLCHFENGRVAELWDIPSPADKEAHDSFFS